MPLPAPVTNATLPAKLPFSFVAIISVPFIARLTVVVGGRGRNLDRAAADSLVAGGGLLPGLLEVENLGSILQVLIRSMSWYDRAARSWQLIAG